ncbi:DUF2779 domain-containing protein [Candidatus Dependentiae bacterium]|nr:DUF2779 domain-containing protein [Candidatus Dependentiae bacterium]
MNKFVHKSIYIEYLQCAKNAWLKLHKKQELQDLLAPTDSEHAIMNKGNLVELWARRLFPEGILIEVHGEDAALLTKSYIEKKTSVLFQSTFYHDQFLVRNDVLEYNKRTGKWSLYEIKGKNSLYESKDKIDHIEDISFQAIILKEQGIELENLFIIHLNKDYLRINDIEIDKLFIINNVTENVKERESLTRERMQRAKIDLHQDKEEASICSCISQGRNAHCKTFSYSYPHVPEISVHDIARINEKRLSILVNSNILTIDDIPASFALTDIQSNQVNSYKFKKTIIDDMAIKQELDKLTYPLYFLDYESYAHPIPLFSGFKPYKHIPFQFSLHVLTDANSEPTHFEYLHEADCDPSEIIIQKLAAMIGPSGTIIVWHKSFEQKINTELGERHSSYNDFFQNLNNRIFDLEEIFKNQLYVHSGFNGKTSIKNIFPILVPELSYDKLMIQDGMDAGEKWFSMMNKELSSSEKSKIAEDLKQYCRLDTYAMYKIWQYLLLIR